MASHQSHFLQQLFVSAGEIMKFFGLRTPLITGLALVTCAVGAIAVAVVHAQPPRGERGPGGGSVDAAVNRLMAFDADKDGKLSKSEITDSRLQPLLQRADANNDGVVTKEELTALLTKEAASSRGGAGGGPGGLGGRGPGGPEGGPGGPPPDDRGPGGRGPGGPQPGQILPQFMQDELSLTEAQRRDLQELQKDVDTRLGKILSADQQQQLRQMRNRGPGGGGPRGGGPGGPPRPQ